MALKIKFKDKRIRELCEIQAVCEKKLGSACARKLRTRLSDLEAASRVTDLVAGNPHPLRGDRLGQFSIALAGGWRLVFIPSHDPYPVYPDGGIDWSRVTSICIEYIGNYHE